jgi:uncharacterized phage protein (TIGR01671 family)
MRELKFRAWDGKRFSYWGLSNVGDQIHFLKVDDGRIVAPSIDAEVFFELKDIQQFTGLKDKNGREVFEGDLIRYTSRTDGQTYVSRVEVSPETTAYRVGGIFLPYALSDDGEVVGNNYQDFTEEKS